MALDAAIQFELSPSGDDDNGGGFKAGASGEDYSLQDAAEVTIDDLAWDGATATELWAADIDTWVGGGGTIGDLVGNLIHVTGDAGSGEFTAGWHEITAAVLDTGNGPNGEDYMLTVDSAAASGTGASDGTAKIGGALTSLGGLGAVLSAHGVPGMSAWAQAGDYYLSSASANVAGGVLNMSTGAMADDRFQLHAYTTTRGDDTGFAVFDAGIYAPSYFIYLDAVYADCPSVVSGIHVKGQSSANTKGIGSTSSAYNVAYRCIAENCDDSASGGFFSIQAIGCKAFNCANHGFTSCLSILCWAHSNGNNGFDGASTTAIHSIASNNGGSGIAVAGLGGNAIGCVAYGNTNSGFTSYTTYTSRIVNCIAVSNGGYAFYNSVSCALINCAYYNNTLSNNTPKFSPGLVALSGDPFTDPTGSGTPDDADFSLNSSAGGEECKEAGLGVYGQTDYRDIGALVREVTGALAAFGMFLTFN